MHHHSAHIHSASVFKVEFCVFASDNTTHSDCVYTLSAIDCLAPSQRSRRLRRNQMQKYRLNAKTNVAVTFIAALCAPTPNIPSQFRLTTK